MIDQKTKLEQRSKEELRRIQIIFQMPDTAMNPRQTVDEIIGRPIEFYQGIKGKEREAKVIEKLKNDDKGCLLDVRSEEEFEESHIPNAKLLNIRNPQSFMDGLERMDKSLNYYVYCHSGVRSVQACQIMKTFGYENLFNLLGGISEWTGEKNNS